MGAQKEHTNNCYSKYHIRKKAFSQKPWILSDSVEDIQTVWKISGQSGIFFGHPRFLYNLGNVWDSLEDFWTIWKISGHFWIFPTVWKISGQFERYLESLEIFRTVWKISKQSWRFSESVENFQTARKISEQSGEFLESLEAALQKSSYFPTIYGFWLFSALTFEVILRNASFPVQDKCQVNNSGGWYEV